MFSFIVDCAVECNPILTNNAYYWGMKWEMSCLLTTIKLHKANFLSETLAVLSIFDFNFNILESWKCLKNIFICSLVYLLSNIFINFTKYGYFHFQKNLITSLLEFLSLNYGVSVLFSELTNWSNLTKRNHNCCWGYLGSHSER